MIVADHHPRDSQFRAEQAVEEVGRARRGKRGVETRHEGAVEPELAQDFELHAFGAEPEQRLVGRKELARMRLEGQDGRRRPARPRLLLGGFDQLLVAAMHAVEIAHRDDRAAQRRRHRLAVAPDREGARRLCRLLD
jgi:hypothetical protein